MGSALMGDLGIRERSLQAVRLLELALVLPDVMTNSSASAAMHCQLGQRLMDLEQFSNAAQELKKAHDIYDNSAMELERGTVLIVVVGLYARFGDMKSVQCAYEQAKAVLADHPDHLANLYQKLARVYLDQKTKDVALGIGALECAEKVYKKVGRVDTIDYVTCMTELARAYAHQAAAGNPQTKNGAALASAEESLDRAWSSLDAIGMTESLNAAHVLMVRHQVGMVREQINGVDRGDFEGLMHAVSGMAISKEYTRAVEITEACGFKKDVAQEMMSTCSGIFGDVFAGRNPDNLFENFGQAGDAIGPVIAQVQRRPVLPSWRAWTHPSLKQCVDVSELAAQVITIISSEDSDAEDAAARKLCQEMLTKLPEQNTTAALSARGTVWTKYLNLVNACSQQLGSKATQSLLRDQKEELTHFQNQLLGMAGNMTRAFSSFGGVMGKGKGKGTSEDMLGGLEDFGNLFGALAGKGKGKGMGGPDASSEECCIQ